MAASSQLIRSSFRKTLFTLHRCFVSTAHLRYSGSASSITGGGSDTVSNVAEVEEAPVSGNENGTTSTTQSTPSVAEQATAKFGSQRQEGLSECDVLLHSAFEDHSDHDQHSEEEYTYDSDEYYDSEDEIRIKVLDAALNHVNMYGWSSDAIAAGAEDVGLSSVAEGMFSKGGGDLALHFIENCNIEMAEYLAQNSRLKESQESGGKPTTDLRSFLKDALQKRLELLGPHINLGTWTQAMRLLMLPQNAPSALENAAHMVDEIWYHAGDTSTDVDWYAKRGVLAAVYGATEVYMLRDRSEGFQDTWEFLDRRLRDVQNAAEVKSKVEQCAQDTAQMATTAFSMARNLIGINSRNR